MASGTPEQLIYDEAVRAIGRQQATASELRSGASLLIATAAIAISLLHERAFAEAAPLAWLAITGFLAVCGCALAVIWPASKVPTGPSIAALVRSLTLRQLVGAVEDTAPLVRLLTSNLADHQQLIARRTAIVSSAFRVGAIALMVQLAATVAARILTT